MVTEQQAPSAGAIPQRPTINVIRISKEEEGSAKGEIWAVLRALAVLVGVIVLIGFVIA